MKNNVRELRSLAKDITLAIISEILFNTSNILANGARALERRASPCTRHFLGNGITVLQCGKCDDEMHEKITKVLERRSTGSRDI